MDRVSLLEQLEQAKRRVADWEDFIAQQRHLIGELGLDHPETAVAKTSLSTLEKHLSMHIARRERLEQELAAANAE